VSDQLVSRLGRFTTSIGLPISVRMGPTFVLDAVENVKILTVRHKLTHKILTE